MTEFESILSDRNVAFAFVRKASTDTVSFSAAATPTIFTGTFYEKANIGSVFTCASAGAGGSPRITNTSGDTIKVMCFLNMTDQQVTTGQVCNMYIAKNGTVDSEQYQEFKMTGNKGNTSMIAYFELANNDYVEPYVSNVVNTDQLRTITTQFMVQTILE